MLAMLSANELRGSLSALGLDTRGSREELEARLAGAGGELDASHGVAGAQQRPQTPARWAVGGRVEAEFRDGHRYDATVAAVGLDTYVVFWAQPDPGDWSAELAKDKVQAYVAPSSSTDVGAEEPGVRSADLNPLILVDGKPVAVDALLEIEEATDA